MRILWFVNVAILLAFIKVFEIPSMIPLLVDDLGIDYAQAGIFMTAYTIIRCLASLPAGSLSDSWGAVRVIGLCLLAIGVLGFLGSFGNNYWLLLTIRVLISIGIAVIFIAAVDAIPKYLPAEQTGKGIGYINVSLNIGIALALFMTPILGELLGWRWTARIYSLSFLVFFLLSLPLLLNPPAIASTGSTNSESTLTSVRMKDLLANVPVMLLALAALIIFMEIYGILTWVPAFLAEVYDYSPAQVGTSATMFGLAAIPASLVTGLLCNSLGRITRLCVSGGLLAGTGILLLILSPYMPLWMTVTTIIVITWGHTQVIVCIMSLAALVVPAQGSGKALGLIFAVGYGGSILPTYLGGYLLEVTGGYRYSFLVFSVSAYASIIAMWKVSQLLRVNPPAHFALSR